MVIEDIRKLTIEELKDKISELKKELIELEFKVRTAQESDFSSLKKMKREIAQMLTVLNEKGREGNAVVAQKEKSVAKDVTSEVEKK